MHCVSEIRVNLHLNDKARFKKSTKFSILQNKLNFLLAGKDLQVIASYKSKKKKPSNFSSGAYQLEC